MPIRTKGRRQSRPYLVEELCQGLYFEEFDLNALIYVHYLQSEVAVAMGCSRLMACSGASRDLSCL